MTRASTPPELRPTPDHAETDTRKTRLSRDQLHDLVLAAGLEILHQEGIETATDNLTFKRAFDRVERTTGIQLTNASVIRRVWENQADFRADVLAAAARGAAPGEVDVTLDVVRDFLDSFDLTSAEARLGAVSELCRVVGVANAQTLRYSTHWPLWVSMVAMATTPVPTEQTGRVQEALRDGYASMTEFWDRTTSVFMARLGLRFREPWTLRQYTVVSSALSEGFALRNYVDEELEPVFRPTGPNGELREWTPFGVAMEALTLQCFEFDPAFRPPVSGPAHDGRRFTPEPAQRAD